MYNSTSSIFYYSTMLVDGVIGNITPMYSQRRYPEASGMEEVSVSIAFQQTKMIGQNWHKGNTKRIQMILMFFHIKSFNQSDTRSKVPSIFLKKLGPFVIHNSSSSQSMIANEIVISAYRNYTGGKVRKLTLF